MRQPAWLVVMVAALFAASVFAQSPDTPNGEKLPSPPYAREDVPAVAAQLAALEEQLTQTRAQITQAETAVQEEGISPEVKATREASLKSLQTAASEQQTRIEQLRRALEAARQGPSREQLDARIEYDRLVALGTRAAAELVVATDGDEAIEGVLARAIRDAEEELGRIAALSAEMEEFKFKDSIVYTRLDDLAKLQYELRWAENRLKLAIDEYDHLATHVFAAYVRYEERALEALRALREAPAHAEMFAGTPAESMDINGQPRPVAELGDLTRQIETRLARRRSRAGADVPMRVYAFEGRLRDAQAAIDVREDFKERLEDETERLKDIVSATAAPSDEAAAANGDGELSEYQKLGQRIDELERDVVDAKRELERIAEERAALSKVVEAKRIVEQEVEAQLRAVEQALRELEEAHAVPEGATRQQRARVLLYLPEIRRFVLNEEIAAINERLSAAKRDTRQTQTQIEMFDRRTESLQEKISLIEEETLPATRDEYYAEIAETVGVRSLKVVVVFAAAWLLVLLIRVFVSPLLEKLVRRSDRKSELSADELQRGRTLMTVFMTTTRLVVYITAIMFTLAQFDVDYGPLLVAAGGVSLAVGFGAQSLVKDFFAGFFILLEGQYSIGDVVEVGGKVGTVENLNLRTTVLRSLNGDVHVIPNGHISLTTNQTKQWSRTIIDVGVAYEENTDDVSAIMEAVAREMREDEAWNKKVLDFALMGVNDLGDSGVVIRLLLKTRAGEQWGASREYKRRIKLRFDELGVEIPWPQRVVSYKGYAEMDAKQRDQESRKKKSRILRYVRKSRGEMTEEDLAIAGMSIEERDRAESMARREVELAKENAESEGKEVAKEAAPEKQPEKPTDSPADTAKEGEAQTGDSAKDETLSDAERLAKQMATRTLKKQDIDPESGKADTKEPDQPPSDKAAKPPDEKK